MPIEPAASTLLIKTDNHIDLHQLLACATEYDDTYSVEITVFLM